MISAAMMVFFIDFSFPAGSDLQDTSSIYHSSTSVDKTAGNRMHSVHVVSSTVNDSRKQIRPQILKT